MQRRPALTFARFLDLPENRSALRAVRELAERVVSGSRRGSHTLYLHGAPGTGKTHLVTALISDATRQAPRLVVASLSAAELSEWARTPGGRDDEPDLRETVPASDLVVVEDMQHLRRQAAEALVALFDALEARGVAMVFTANVGPAGLDLPARLRSRLACGLVVGLEPLQATSRRAFLEDPAARRQVPLPADVLSWLAGHLPGSGRELDGALTTLETLSRQPSSRLDLKTIAHVFADQAEAKRPTVERIAQRVCTCFRVQPRDVQSSRRSRQVLLPRQVGMYLARQLTALSLAQIGDYFGGRDHTTVLHACRKVERALEKDPVLNGTIRQLHAELA